jgi:hypothetical protein
VREPRRRWPFRRTRGLRVPLHLPEQPEDDRPRRLVLLQVDQELGECAALWVAPELSDPVDPVEVWEAKDVEELGAGCGTERVQTLPKPASQGQKWKNPRGVRTGTRGFLFPVCSV